MTRSVIRSAAVVSASILSSRVLGLLRDVVIASTFGASTLSDTFFVAFRIPNLLRRIFAEGAFSSVFVPAFTKELQLSRERALQFASRVLGTLLILLTATVVAGELFAPLIVKAVAPGFSGESFRHAVKLLREMFPYIALISLTAFYGGVLNSLNHFFAPSFSTTLFNLALIVSALTLGKWLSVEALAVGVIAGGILQLLLVTAFAKRERALVRPTFRLTPKVKETIKNMIPGLFSFAVRQISMLIDTVMASFLAAGAISYLYYANRFVQLPLGMFAIGLSQVLLPRFSRRSGAGLKEEIEIGIRLCSALIIPAAVGLTLFGMPIIDLIFNHGAFSDKALKYTYYTLIGYSVGLFFFSLEKIVTNAYYSLEEFSLPVKISALTLGFNGLFNLVFCFLLNLGTMGLALGTSLTSLINLTLLIRFLKRRFSIEILNETVKAGAKYTLLSLPVGVIAAAGSKLYRVNMPTAEKLLIVGITVTAAATVYAVTLYITKDPIIQSLKEG
ncbi:murein biosynthesis integral membrane protein MurJ [Thermovibrio ammonificans]